MRLTTYRSPRDKPRVGGSAITVPSGKPVDLAQTENTWLFRAYRSGADIVVENSRNAGQTWSGVTVASDAEESGDGSAPTLLVTRWDEVMVWYHDAGSVARAYLSQDYGATWSLFATVAGLRYPRAALVEDGIRLAGVTGGALAVYSSHDYGVTRVAVSSVTGADDGLCALRPDRRQILHLVYRAAGAILHRYSLNLGDTWSAAATLGSGRFPTYALGLERALIGYFDGTAADEIMAATDETMRDDVTLVTPPPGNWEAHWAGLLWAHREIVYWCAVLTGGGLETRFSRDSGLTWGTP